MSQKENLFDGQSLSVSLTVSNLDTSLRWYRDIVGFSVTQTFEREGKLFAVSLKAGNARVLITQDDGKRGDAREKGAGLDREADMKIADMLLGQLERDIPATHKIVERFPDGMNDWKPHPKSMPLGYLSSLVAGMFGWITMMVPYAFLIDFQRSRRSAINVAR